MTQDEKRPKESNPNTAQPQSEQRGGGTQGQDARPKTTGKDTKTTPQTSGGRDPNKGGTGRG